MVIIEKNRHTKIKEVVWNHFKGYCYTWDYLDLIVDVMDSIDEYDWDEHKTETLYEAIDSEIIYDEQMWIILRQWCRPNEPDWEQAYQCFVGDCEEIWEVTK